MSSVSGLSIWAANCWKKPRRDPAFVLESVMEQALRERLPPVLEVNHQVAFFLWRMSIAQRATDSKTWQTIRRCRLLGLWNPSSRKKQYAVPTPRIDPVVASLLAALIMVVQHGSASRTAEMV